MRQSPRTRLARFGAAAAAVALAATLVVADAAHDRRPRGEPRHPPSERVTRVVGDSRPRLARRPVRSVSAVQATKVARRFAASWSPWDAGRRRPHGAATLRRLSVTALWRRLRHQRVRPTASPPPASLELQPMHAVPVGRGIWRASLIGRHPENSYLGTLVIIATSAGPRVAEIER
jgi:hypothetical protein